MQIIPSEARCAIQLFCVDCNSRVHPGLFVFELFIQKSTLRADKNANCVAVDPVDQRRSRAKCGNEWDLTLVVGGCV